MAFYRPKTALVSGSRPKSTPESNDARRWRSTCVRIAPEHTLRAYRSTRAGRTSDVIDARDMKKGLRGGPEHSMVSEAGLEPA